MIKKIILSISIILLLFSISGLAQETDPPTIIPVSPIEYETVTDVQPTIIIEYSDPSGIDVSSITLIVDAIDVTEFDSDEIIISDSRIEYTPTQIFSLQNGDHTIEFSVRDLENNVATLTWGFTVDTTAKQSSSDDEGFNLLSLITYVIYGTIIVFIAIALYILYLKKTKKFTFQKFLAQHEIDKEIFVLYIPIIIAFIFIIFSLAYINETDNLPLYSTEYVFVIGVFIGIGPYAIESQYDRRRRLKYEQAYAQFLFETADAMRGGLDPTKAVIELSKTDTGMLRKRLKIAADNIKIGRPFDDVMPAMVRGIKSELVQRYSAIIGETSRIGGDPAIVIHRAAKDMDDFIKVNQERRRQLATQTTIIYIAFAVLLISLYQLLQMVPNIGSFDTSVLSATDVSVASTGGSSAARMSLVTVKQRFLDLMIINSIGTGTIIGSFIDGNIRFGLIHSLVLVSIVVLFFVFLIA